MQLGAIPVDLNDRCIMVDEIGDRHHNSMCPLKWKCTNEHWLLTNRSCIEDKGAISKMNDSTLHFQLKFRSWGKHSMVN